MVYHIKQNHGGARSVCKDFISILVIKENEFKKSKKIKIRNKEKEHPEVKNVCFD